MKPPKKYSPYSSRLALLRRQSKVAKALAVTAVLSAIGLPVFAPSAGAATTLYWDGGTANIDTNGDGVSQGGVGTWNTTVTNWDQGNGLAHIAWPNTTAYNASFGGTAGTVTLGTNITAGELLFTTTGYMLTGNTLTLGASAGGTIIDTSALTSGSTTTINSNIATTPTTGTTAATDTITVGTGNTLNLGGTVAINGIAAATQTLVIGSGTTVSTGSSFAVGTYGKFSVNSGS